MTGFNSYETATTGISRGVRNSSAYSSVKVKIKSSKAFPLSEVATINEFMSKVNEIDKVKSSKLGKKDINKLIAEIPRQNIGQFNYHK